MPRPSQSSTETDVKTLTTALLVSLAVATCLVAVALSAGVEMDLSGTLSHLRRKTNQLDGDLAGTNSRLQARQQITAEWVAGRLSLGEALDRTRDLYPNGFTASLPGETEDERLGLTLACWARACRPEDERDALVARLRSELRDHLGREPVPWSPANFGEGPQRAARN
jgi:hypothetical protein